LALWPRAAVGLVRAAAETWLRTPAAGRIPVEAMARAIADWLLTGLIGAAPGASLDPAAADADRARPHSRTGASS
ncbi:TetR/AcrR family transcriptional regulator, partial [Micrococcus luteus]